MKRISILTLVLVLTLCLAACGRNNKPTSTTNASAPTNGMTILPDPTIGTNIPDPDVDTSMPIYTEGTGSNDATGHSTGTESNMGMGTQP